jgi:outer membrane protein OmpA-like peptidoglycan-associated protein
MPIRAMDRLPGPDRLGGWAVLALILSVMLHLAVFLMLDRMDFRLRYRDRVEMSTEPIRIRQVEVKPSEPEVREAPESVVTPPQQAATLMDEIDLLAALPEDREIDIKPQIDEAEYALKLSDPAMKSEQREAVMDSVRSYEFDAGMPELGREPEPVEPSAIGRMTIDPGSMKPDDGGAPAAGGWMQGSIGRGMADGVATLDEMLELPPNVLLSSRTMLPGDLLFEFNSDELRESAKVGLMKLALLMDRNPSMHCWIDGHADRVGSDAFNVDLSRRRAAAVKRHLVDSLRMDESKIHTRGFGRSRPIVTSGDVDAQSVNRRVEIKMRDTPPPVGEEPVIGDVAQSPPKALPVNRDGARTDDAALEPAIPRAEPVEESSQKDQLPKAVPVDE